MSELSPDLRALVLAGKRSSLPTEADSARVLAALRARLGDAALMGAAAAQKASISASAGYLYGKVSAIGLAGLALLGGIWFFAARNHRDTLSASNSVPSVAATSTVAPSAISVGAPTPPNEQTSGVVAIGSPGSERAESRGGASQHGRDRLAEEVALLSRAEMALHGGKPAVALDVLNEHERRFGSGLLTEERIAARVQALCALGRKAEADVQMARLSSKSLHGAQPGQACSSRKSN